MEALIGVIIGGTISFFSGYFIEYRKDKKENKKLKKEKLEKLFFNYLKWENLFVKIYDTNVRFQQDKLTIQHLHEQINRIAKEDNIGDLHKQFVVSLNLYFPSLARKYKRVDNARSSVSKYFIFEKTNVNDMISNYDIFLIESQKFKDSIIEESIKINY